MEHVNAIKDLDYRMERALVVNRVVKFVIQAPVWNALLLNYYLKANA